MLIALKKTSFSKFTLFMYFEKVVRFNLHSFEEFFAANNLKTMRVYGDCQLNEYDPGKSKRLIILAKKC